MDKFYLCPHCKGHLKVGEYIIFTANAKGKSRGLLLLHPEIGNYTSLKHPGFKFKDGDELEFYCPICQERLVSDFDKRLAHVILVEKNGKQSGIYFSKIAGEHSTYKVSDGEVSAAGEHSSRYTCFKLPDEYKEIIIRNTRKNS